MSNFTTQLVTTGYLILASIPVAAGMVSVAHAQPQPAYVKIGDLDLASPQGQKVFAQRVHSVARTFCGDEARLGAKDACMSAVRHEANDKLAQAMQTQGARTTTLAAR